MAWGRRLSHRLLKNLPAVRALLAERDALAAERAALALELRARAEDRGEARPAFAPPPPGTNLARLHLGCGRIHLPGWCNVDVLPGRAVDVVADITRLEGFPDGASAAIYACHVLEHFAHAEVPAILARWHAVLRPGGELRVSVPDLDRIVRIYADHPEHFRRPGASPWIGLIYGGQLDAFDFHKTGFNLTWMTKLLHDAGFIDVAEYPHEPHFVPGVRDASQAKEPFGVYVSLNVVARKPATASAAGNASPSK